MALYAVFVTIIVALGLHASEGNQLEMMDGAATRIVNGNIADYAQFPYVVSLQQISLLSQTTRGHTCGGALITLQRAITSGSCLYTTTVPYTLKTPSQYRVFAGAALLTNDTSANYWRNVAEFTPHPNYTGPTSYVNDIGLINLASAFSADIVSPLAVSTATPADNTYCTVAGWGATLAGAQASVNLLYVNRLTINQTACAVMSVGAGGPALESHMLCVGNTAAYTPSCTNDTGNPLICGGVLTGVLSWYSACSLTSSLEIYTRTASFSSWATGVTGSATSPAPMIAVLFIAAVIARIVSTASVF